jgi:hypothetical protein
LAEAFGKRGTEREKGETRTDFRFIVRETAALCNGTRREFREKKPGDEKKTARKEKRRTQTRKNESRSTLYVKFR